MTSPAITHRVPVFTQIPNDPIHTHSGKHIAVIRQALHAMLTALIHPT